MSICRTHQVLAAWSLAASLTLLCVLASPDAGSPAPEQPVYLTLGYR